MDSSTTIKDISTLPTVFETKKLPNAENSMATVANGYLGTIVYSENLYLNGFYNGRGLNSHRAKIPSPCNVRVSLPVLQCEEIYRLDVKEAVFYHQISTPDYAIEQRIYAHQLYPQLLVCDIIIQKNHKYANEIIVSVQDNFTPESSDLEVNFSSDSSVSSMYGKILAPESDTSGYLDVFIFWNQFPKLLILQPNEERKSWFSIISVSQIKSKALESYKLGTEMTKADELFNSHIASWETKWKSGNIDLDGDVYLSKAIHASMYYILSSLPPIMSEEFPFYGLSPGSLATGGRSHDDDYHGHVFWDMEIWMYPPILAFHPSLARKMLLYRVQCLDEAKNKARRHGYRGAMFPWESAYSGIEVCPGAVYANNEQHITGDIAWAVQQYLYVTRDVSFLTNDGGWELIYNIAVFWESRVDYDDSIDKYVINSVMPPDEYHHCIDNSVYTNVIATISLMLPYFAAKLMKNKVTVPEQWRHIADNIYIPFDEKNKYHPEFDGYTKGSEVKQADVILLGYPLMYDMPKDVRKNDLINYAKVTDSFGPAMTWSMFAIGWLELKDFEKADKIFKRSYAHIQEPFKTWSEVPDGGGAYNFITGMGGFLQTIIFGYAGIRIYSDHLEMNPVLPYETNNFVLHGVHYLGSAFMLEISDTMVTVTRTTKNENSPELHLVQNDKSIPLSFEKSVSVPREKLIIQP